MSILEVAKQVLLAAGHELTRKEIADKVIASGLWAPTGKTPQHSIEAQIYSDIKHHPETTPFCKTGRGKFGLKSYAAQEVEKESTPPPPLAKHPGASVAKGEHGFSFTECAVKVLEKHGNRQPMHYRDITKRAIEEGWLVSKGKTPEASLYAQVITEIQRCQKKGDAPRFVQCGKGFVALARWSGNGLDFQITQHNKAVSLELKKRLQAMTPGEFEELIALLLPKMGFVDVELTPLNNDGGIDVRGVVETNDVVRTKMAVQVKRWKKNVQSPTVQQVRGSLGAHEQGLIITLSDFSKGAREEASKVDKVPIALMNGDVLVSLLMEYEIGVRRISRAIFELEDKE
ncbi:MAG: HTH domain-containing protein [Oligosphaeraceae bacterium]